MHPICPGLVTTPLPSIRSIVVFGDRLPVPPPLPSASNPPDGESSAALTLVRGVPVSCPVQSLTLTWPPSLESKHAIPAGEGQASGTQLPLPMVATRLPV